jgi:hypothetical protein
MHHSGKADALVCAKKCRIYMARCVADLGSRKRGGERREEKVGRRKSGGASRD